jgi:hypothetical protein
MMARLQAELLDRWTGNNMRAGLCVLGAELRCNCTADVCRKETARGVL